MEVDKRAQTEENILRYNGLFGQAKEFRVVGFHNSRIGRGLFFDSVPSEEYVKKKQKNTETYD